MNPSRFVKTTTRRGALLFLAALFTLYGCSESTTIDLSQLVTPPPPPTGPLSGDDGELATSVIEDVYVSQDIEPEEFTEDVDGQWVLRTGLSIVFADNATIGDANRILNEQSAEIIASLDGFPQLAVRIPDPGSLQDLRTLIASIEAEPAVQYAMEAWAPEPQSLPANVAEAINASADPEMAIEWKAVNQHLAVRAGTSWDLASLMVRKPIVIVADFFGGGDADTAFFDIETIVPGGDYGFDNWVRPASCDTPQMANNPVCRVIDDHGYSMLSIIAGRHSTSGANLNTDFVTGMLPGGARVGIVDMQKTRRLDADLLLLAQRLKFAMDSVSGTIPVNMSWGYTCGKTAGPGDDCVPLTHSELTKNVISLMSWVDFINARDRVLFVSAAGNRRQDPATGQNTAGPMRARAASPLNAAALNGSWTDPKSGITYPPLTNVLIVENAQQFDGLPAPFSPGCIHESSFIGGQIAAIGMDTYEMEGPTRSSNAPETSAAVVSNGGTSAATAQLTGLAAYVTAIHPLMTPSQVKGLLLATSFELPNFSTLGDCTADSSSALIADALGAVLATDDPGLVGSAEARLALLDVTGFSPGSDPDGSFDIFDLRKWIAELGSATNPDGIANYSRYDINGDGWTGGTESAAFDLDISMDRNAPVSSTLYNDVNYFFLGRPITYSEQSVTDMEVVCYYANTDLFDLTGIDENARDAELERVRVQCEGVVVVVSPSSATLAPGEQQQFSATVTGATDTTATWTATGGTIDANGLYTAGTVDGSYMVTATSNADNSVSGSAIVDIDTPVVNITVSVSPSSVSLSANEARQFSATVTGATDTSVTWSASGGSITAGGLYTAPGGDGTYTVTATSNEDPSVSDQVTVTVASITIPADVSAIYETTAEVRLRFGRADTTLRSNWQLTIDIDQQGSSVEIEVSDPAGYFETNTYSGTRDGNVISAVSNDCDPRAGNECPFDATIELHHDGLGISGVRISGQCWEDDPDEADSLGGTGARYANFEVVFVPE